MVMPCIGLFGTCGGSRWRESFIKRYSELRMIWYDPQVENWTPDLAEIEASHLASDPIILFAVTNETYAFGSLAESGFSIMNAMRLDDRREFVLYIAQDLADVDSRGYPLDDRRRDGAPNPDSQAIASLRARALVRQHILKLTLPNVYLVDSLDEMLNVSIRLWEIADIRNELEGYTPQARRRLASTL